MIHFFHEAHSATAKKKLREEIAIEQCSGWFFLRRLLERWDPIFSDYNEKINAINYSMKEHEIYLDTVFKRITPEIKKAKEQGINFVGCKRCKKEASEENQRTDNIFEYKCRVCLFEDGAIKIDCPTEECNQKIVLESGDPDQKILCTACDTDLSSKDLSEILDTEYHDHGDFVQKNCAACGGHGSVVQHEDFYVCSECFYFTKDIGYCGWCSEGQIAGGDLEHSYHTGCEFCDGFSGWT